MSKKYSSTKTLEAMAHAIENVPGFARLLWNAADKMNAVKIRHEELHRWEQSHTSRRGKTYQALQRDAWRAEEAFVVAADAAQIVIDAMVDDEDGDGDWIHYMVLTEIEQLRQSVSMWECLRNARNV